MCVCVCVCCVCMGGGGAGIEEMNPNLIIVLPFGAESQVLLTFIVA